MAHNTGRTLPGRLYAIRYTDGDGYAYFCTRDFGRYGVISTITIFSKALHSLILTISVAVQYGLIKEMDNHGYIVQVSTNTF
jgi:hypothetical protein